MKDIGCAGLVRSALWIDLRLGGEVLFVGLGALAREDCELQIALTHMVVHVTLGGGWAWVYVAEIDQVDPPEFLFNVGDGPEGWTTVRAFVAALERSGIRSLQPRPIHLGPENGSNTFVIA